MCTLPMRVGSPVNRMMEQVSEKVWSPYRLKDAGGLPSSRFHGSGDQNRTE